MRSDICLQGSKILFKVIGIVMVIFTGIFQAMAVLLVGIGGVFLKSLAVIMSAIAVLMFFLSSFSGWSVMIVILTAMIMFWLPEAAAIFLGGIIFLQRKIMDTILN